MNKIRIWLSHPFLQFIAPLLAVSLVLPSLGTGFNLDDNLYRLVIQGESRLTPPSSSPLNLYCIMDGNPVENRRLMSTGIISWWNPEKTKMFFFRPLSALTHWFDFFFWPNTPLLMHVQNLAWFGVLVFLTALLYRRLMGATWMVGLATLFFAVDPAHNMTVNWIAGRNTLLAGGFGVLCLVIHHRWRKGWTGGIVLGPLCFALSLLSAETGIATIAYLLAYVLFLEDSTLRNRLASFALYGIVLLLWYLVYSILGYGVAGHSHIYVDPASEPLLYFKALFLRAPIYLLGQWFFLPPPPFSIIWGSHLFRAGLIVASYLTLILVPLLRRDKITRFWATGMALSLLPICTALPQDRYLLFVGLGVMGLVARLFAFVNPVELLVKSRLWRIATLVFLIQFTMLHGLIAPLWLSFSSRSVFKLQKSIEFVSATLPSGPAFNNQKFILVNTPAYLMYVTFVIIHRTVQGALNPCIGLTNGFIPLTLTRTDSNTLEVRSKRGSLTGFEYLPIRDRKYPMRQGDKVELDDMVIEVLKVYAGLPSAASFRFSVPLEDSSLAWFRWQDGGYVPFSVPSIGETLNIEGARYN